MNGLPWSNGFMWILALFLISAAPEGHAGVDVHTVGGGRVDVRATAAPLSEVLDRLSKQVGMKVVFEGPPERQLVTATLVGRTPAEAVLGILDGLGLNYALSTDSTGQHVQTLLISGPAPVSSGTPAASPPPAPARAEEHTFTSWDDADDAPDVEGGPTEAGKAGENPFVPQEGTNGRAVKRQEGGGGQAAPPASPSPAPQNPGEWVPPAPQPLAFPTPTPPPTPAAPEGETTSSRISRSRFP